MYLTDRCELLRQIVTDTNDYEDHYCMQRQVYSALAKIDAAQRSCCTSEITAAGLCGILENFSPVIIPGELIVGFHYPDTKYPERFTPEDTKEHRALAEKNGISSDALERYFTYQKDPKCEVYFDYIKPRPDYASLVSSPATEQERSSTQDQSSIVRNIEECGP